MSELYNLFRKGVQMGGKVIDAALQPEVVQVVQQNKVKHLKETNLSGTEKIVQPDRPEFGTNIAPLVNNRPQPIPGAKEAINEVGNKTIEGIEQGVSSFTDVGNLIGKTVSQPFKSAIKSSSEFFAPVVNGVQEYMKPVTDVTNKIGETTRDYIAKPLMSLSKTTYDSTKPIRDALDTFNAFIGNTDEKKFEKIKAGTMPEDSLEYKVYQTVKKEAGDMAVKTFDNFKKATQKLNEQKPDLFKGVATAGLKTMGYLVDILERPIRKTILPWYYYGMATLGDVVDGKKITPERLKRNQLLAEYVAGGSTENIGKIFNSTIGMGAGKLPDPSLLPEMLRTETATRAEKAKQLGELYNVKPDEIHTAFNTSTVFGVPVLSLLDTITSYSASMGEAMLAPSLISLGKEFKAPVLTTAGNTLEAASKAIYPTAVGTTLVDMGMRMLSPDKAQGLYEYLASGQDPDLEQTISVFHGIATLGTILKVVGKVLPKAQPLSLLDQVKAMNEAIKKIDTDPALLGRMLQQFKKDYGVQIEYLMRPEVGQKGALTVDDIYKLDDVIKQLPADIQKGLQDVQMKLFYSSFDEDWVGGYALSQAKRIGLNYDTLRKTLTDLKSGKIGEVEANETLLHEMGHLASNYYKADPQWNKIVKGTKFGEGGKYMFTNPGELFAEGLRKFYHAPELLQAEAPKLYDFMKKVSGDITNAFQAPIMKLEGQPVEAMGRMKQDPVLKPVIEKMQQMEDPDAVVNWLLHPRRETWDMMFGNDWELKSANIDDLIPNQPLVIKGGAEGGEGFNKSDVEIYSKWLKEGDTPPPILVDKDGLILDGHRRLQSYMVNGHKRIPILQLVGEGSGKIVNLQATGKEFMPRMKSPDEDYKAMLAEAHKGTGGTVPVDQKLKPLTNLSEEDFQSVKKLQDSLGLDTRNVRSFEDMQTVAQNLGTDPVTLLKSAKNGLITDAERVALGNMLNTNTQFIAKATQELASGKSLDPEMLKAKILAAENQNSVALKKFILSNTEAGRSIVANKILSRYMTDPAGWFIKASQEYGKPITPEMRGIITDYLNQKDMLGLSQYIALLREPTLGEKIITLWKAGLLTSPTTHIRNILSNTAFGTMEDLKNIPAVILDKLASVFTGKRTVALWDIGDTIKGIPKGLGEAQEFMKYGMAAEDLGKNEIIREISYGDSPLGKGLDAYTHTIFRVLSAEDKVFKARIEYTSLVSQAKALAMNEGLSGKEYKQRWKELVNNPTPEMQSEAANVAAYGTFNRNNTISDALLGARQGLAKPDAASQAGGVALNVVAPFVRTPTNVALATLDYSPLGFIKTVAGALTNPSQKKIVEGLARNLTGTGLIAIGAIMAENGMMTGVYPSSGDEKKQWQLKQIKAGNAVIDGKQYNLMNISPFGNLLQIGAAFHDTLKDDPDFMNAVSATAANAVKGMTQQTFLMGLSQALGTFTDPERNAKKWVSSMIGSMVPTVVGQLVESSDKYQRESNQIFDQLSAKLPFLRQGLLPKRDLLGERMETPTTANLGDSAGFLAKVVSRMLDPFNITPVHTNELIDEYHRLQDAGVEHPWPTLPARKRTMAFDAQNNKGESVKIKVPLNMNDADYNEFRRIYGQTMAQAQTLLITTEDYQRANDIDKAKALDAIQRDALQVALKLMLPVFIEHYPEFKQALENQKSLVQ